MWNLNSLPTWKPKKKSCCSYNPLYSNPYNAEDASWGLFTRTENVTVESWDISWSLSCPVTKSVKTHRNLTNVTFSIRKHKMKTTESIQNPNPNQHSCITSSNLSFFSIDPFYWLPLCSYFEKDIYIFTKASSQFIYIITNNCTLEAF